MTPSQGATIAALLILAFGALAFVGVVPVFLRPPVASECAWYDIPCQTAAATQGAFLAPLYALLRLVLAGGVLLVGLLVLFRLPAPWGARGLMFVGFLLLALAMVGVGR